MTRRTGLRPPPRRYQPRISRWVGRFLSNVLWRTEARDWRTVPKKGAAILVANHVGFIDGPVVHGVVRRGTHILVTQRMFRGILRPILTGAGCIEVDESGREALARALAVLRRGDVVGVFPEGTRGAGGAENTQGGAAWLAVQSDAPIIPLALFGTRYTGESVNIWPKPGRRILVAFGEPFHIERPEGLRGGALVRHAQAEIEERLRLHVRATSATTDMKLPTDDPLRERGKR